MDENTNTISNITYNSVLDLKTARKIVFRQYIKALASKNIQPIDVAPENYEVWISEYIPDIQNVTNESVFNWENNIAPYIIGESLGILKNIKTLTVNKITNEETKIYEAELYNIPASAIIFSTSYNSNTYIKKDWNYDTYFDGNPLISYKHGEHIEIDNLDETYWKNNYAFDNNYDYNEYQQYEIVMETYPEDMTKVVSSDFSYELKKNVSKFGSLIISVKTSDNKYIPVLYWDLHNSINTLNGKININWSDLGLITVSDDGILVE